LSRNTAAYALVALAPLTAYSQNGPTPETHGIVVANMDRSAEVALRKHDPILRNQNFRLSNGTFFGDRRASISMRR